MLKSIRQDLSVRIGLVILCISVVIGLSYYTYSVHYQEIEFRNSIEQKTKNISDTFTLQLWLFDLNTTRELCKNFLEYPEVRGLILLDQNKKVIFRKEVSSHEEPTTLIRKELRHKKEKLVGYLEIFYSNITKEQQRKNIMIVGLLMVFGTIIGSLFFIDILLRRYLTRSLDDLQKDMSLLAKGKFRKSGLENQKIEVQNIIDTFNNLTMSLQKRDAALYEANKIINRSPAVAFLWQTAQDWPVEFVSDNVEDLVEYSPRDFIEKRISYKNLIHKDDLERVEGEVISDRKEGGAQTFLHEPYRLVSKNGAIKWVKDQSYLRKDSQGIITHIEGIVYDITDEIKLEEHLKQSQKMEAIGTLAGGIAHDFNNILAAIVGYTEMARDGIPEESLASKDLDKVLEASTRATDLVKQILSFSRQDETEYIPLQPADIVNKAITMLRSTLPTTIEIIQNIDTETGFIFADQTQIHQIMMNLCTNAFHAMEETGGRLDISLKEIDLCREDIAHEPQVDTSSFIQLSVSDSGPGMTQEVKDKIFDPYFTTKGVGKGTGMGLSIVHGIIKSYGGFITLSSEPGKGTAFHIFLPVVSEELMTEKEAIKQIPIGTEKILFVDDEDILADMGKDMLERLGYHVTVRKNSIDALETFQNQPDLFDLVITDQTMPGMTGVDLARRMLQIRPDIPIILCTGYSSIISEEKAKSIGIREFALKPLTKKDIAVLIRKALDDI